MIGLIVVLTNDEAFAGSRLRWWPWWQRNLCTTHWAFTHRARQSGLVPSMGSVGDCFDNAVVESFWGRMQVELLNRQRWRTRIELANAIFEYLEIFHNRRRRHSALGMHAPIEYERIHHDNQPRALQNRAS